MTYDAKTLRAAIKEAGKAVKLLSRKSRNANLEMCACDMAEAYEIGVEETQREILQRLTAMLAAGGSK